MNTIQEKKLERVKPILLVDGLNVFTRHFCANPTMSSNGQAVGGIVGFLNDLANKVDIKKIEELPAEKKVKIS
jgi:hypothetical protein